MASKPLFFFITPFACNKLAMFIILVVVGWAYSSRYFGLNNDFITLTCYEKG